LIRLKEHKEAQSSTKQHKATQNNTKQQKATKSKAKNTYTHKYKKTYKKYKIIKSIFSITAQPFLEI
jgi:hypothetical protein